MLYGKYLKIQLKSAFEYRTALIFDTITSALNTVVTFLGIFFLFQSFETVAGYTFYDVLITYSIICMAHSISECFFRGFDQFEKLIIKGELDRLLIRPRSLFIQILGYKIEFVKIGRIILCLGVLIFALIMAPIQWTIMKVITLILMILGSILLFLGMFLIYSGLCIFTVEGLEVVNVFTCGGRDMAEYPLDIYSKFFKVIFTYVIPFGMVNYLPLRYLLGYSNTLLHAFAPVFVLIFFAICYLFFRWALTKYKSTGS